MTKSETALVKKLEARIAALETAGKCPTCGHCQACGRSNHWPYYYTVTGAGSTVNPYTYTVTSCTHDSEVIS